MVNAGWGLVGDGEPMARSLPDAFSLVTASAAATFVTAVLLVLQIWMPTGNLRGELATLLVVTLLFSPTMSQVVRVTESAPETVGVSAASTGLAGTAMSTRRLAR